LVKLLGFFAVTQPPFAALPGFCVYKCNLLKARMIVTTYNQHIGLLSPEPFGWVAPPKFARPWEPTLLSNLNTQNRAPETFKVNQPTLPNFHFDLNEVSGGAWKVKATHTLRPRIEISGGDPDALMARVKSEAEQMEAEIKLKLSERHGQI
jgi:hypothetical protein